MFKWLSEIWQKLVVWSDEYEKKTKLDKAFVLKKNTKNLLKEALFEPYFSDEVKMQVETLEEHNKIKEILMFDSVTLMELGIDLDTEVRLDGAFKHSRDYQVQSKALLRRNSQLEKEALHPKTNVAETIRNLIWDYSIANIVSDLSAQASENHQRRYGG